MVLADRNAALAETEAVLLAARGARAAALALDVTDRASVSAAVQATVEALGGLDILVTSAGVSRPAPFLDMAEAAFDDVVAVNLKGTFLCAQAAGRVMAASGRGSIVMIASNCAQRATSRRANYNASKGGVISLMQSAACELAPNGVRVNAISPGPVDSPMSRRNHTPALRQAILRATPMARYGEAAEIAAAAVWLASDEAGYVTGHELTVDGGCAAGLYLYED